MTNLVCTLFGVGFGFVLGWAHLSDPEVILSMLLLREADVFLIMGSAIAVGTIGTRVLKATHARALLDGAPVTWRTLRPTRVHVVGGALFGVGWAVGLACPGPIAVMLGSGQWSGAFSAIGMLAGVALHDARFPHVSVDTARAVSPPEQAAAASVGL